MIANKFNRGGEIASKPPQKRRTMKNITDNGFWMNNNPDIYINRHNLSSVESTFQEVTKSGKSIYYMLRTAPVKNTHCLVEPMENTYIKIDWYPKEILKEYDTIPQYYAACLLHVLDVMGYVSKDIVCGVKKMLKLSDRQERTIWN